MSRFFRILSSVALLASLQAASVPSLELQFTQLRKSPAELYAFLLRMPKGGDLHIHLAGANYAENIVSAAADSGFCIDKKTMAIVSACSSPDLLEAARANNDNQMRNALIDTYSMRDFVPGRQPAHDHFFNAFPLFSPVDSPHSGEFVAQVARRAADQNESYLELMALAGNGPIAQLGGTVGFNGNFAETAAKLKSAGLPDLVSSLKAKVDEIEKKRLAVLNCENEPASAPCQLVVRYIYQVLREFPKEQVLAQVLAGFELASIDPRVVAVNLVQPEDGINSMRDYHLHMQMVNFAKGLYPKVHITLHAGELASGLVPPEGLRFHIREAIELGHAERIGHGVDIMYETGALELLRRMRANHIAVEINLTSNDLILGVKGNDHPFPVYRKYGVPVVISTDDEGVSRSHLTQEYQRAVLTYGLSYADLKQIVRNSLEYSFLSGESFWSDATYTAPIKACAAGVNAKACQTFLAHSDKATAQAGLENRFRRFEADTIKK
jgi:adenosine deaminase